MKTVGWNLLINIEKETEDTISINGKELFFESKFNTMYNARRHGTVKATNERLESLGLKEGRKCHFHHFVPVEANETHYHVSHKLEEVSDNGDKVYEANVHPLGTQVYAYEDEEGVVHTLYDYLFVEPIVNEIPKTESGIFLDYTEREVIEEGIIKYCNDNARKLGIDVGDKVRFTKNSEYDMEIKGDTLYRMKLEDLLFVYEEPQKS